VNIFFDMDYTIIGQDGSVRPGTHEIFEELVGLGHNVYVWSGIGVRRDEVRKAGLGRFVKGVYQKPLTDFRRSLVHFGVPVVPDFVIDDHPDIVQCFGGMCIKEYVSREQPDKELYAVLGHVDAHTHTLASPSQMVED
jgi:hypothetical protein